MADDTAAYLTLPGHLAFSGSRLARLATSVGATRIGAIWTHFVQLHRPLNAEAEATLHEVLEYGEPPSRSDSLAHSLVRAVRGDNEALRPDQPVLYVIPRAGTISPWSSQATGVAQICGLSNYVQRIERGIAFVVIFDQQSQHQPSWKEKLYDRMTQTIRSGNFSPGEIFQQKQPKPLATIPLLGTDGPKREVLEAANKELGLALDDGEIDYLIDAYRSLRRNPTDVELFMFAQVNSEHCRHKIFNASWTIDGKPMPNSLFSMIRNTHQRHPEHVVSAYSDNAAVFEGSAGSFWAPNEFNGEWRQTLEKVHFLGKVETHNHPTAISPYPGAATGSGGEIRDEGAVGRGSRPKAGLTGFCVSDLLIPGEAQPWELEIGKPSHITSSLDIMLEAPLGSAQFNNEFGRPCLTGFFRTLTINAPTKPNEELIRGYHKPIMVAGGVGTVRPQHALKKKELMQPGTQLIVLGGPAMLIGLGGGAASSVQSGEATAELDFASVQRGNAEVQRRVQEVINACANMGNRSPIQMIHDVGAGGLSNAFPELVDDAGLGATFELREIDNADTSMSPLQIWCCEAQERYVVAVAVEAIDQFKRICQRERCGYSVAGNATGDNNGQGQRLILMDRDGGEASKPIDLPMSTLFGKPPKMSRIDTRTKPTYPDFSRDNLLDYMGKVQERDTLSEVVNRVLALPSVGSKSFLITIGDRSVGGLSVRDQMVGRWQVPVADVAVTAASLLPGIKTGEAMAMGEKPLCALIDSAAAARMAVAESLMNLAAAHTDTRLEKVRLSANWMAASSHPGEGAGLYDAVETLGMDLLPELGISIPVGKDSMSMKMKWKDESTKEEKSVTAPISLIVTAFAPVQEISSTWTPALQRYEDVGETLLMFVDLAQGAKALGGSALGQCFKAIGQQVPDIRDVELFKDFFDAIDQLHETGIVLAYHDRSDGGLFTTLAEMMFAGRCGIDVMLDELVAWNRPEHVVEALFNEELGAVFQIRKRDEMTFKSCFATCGPPPNLLKRVGRVSKLKDHQNLNIYYGPTVVYSATRTDLQTRWSSTSYHMQRLRDDPTCADEEHASILDDRAPGLAYKLTFSPKENIMPLSSRFSSMLASPVRGKPRVAILREQGVNGHAEMAFAFAAAGFAPIDVHMTDILSRRVSLGQFAGLAACGGFSYGDVLGAGQGWAKSVLLNQAARSEFSAFFARPDSFTLGVCNGCQFLSRLAPLIPGAAEWPRFARNRSEQYEARVSMVRVNEAPRGVAPSVFLHAMAGSELPVVVAHAEGRAVFPLDESGTSTEERVVKELGLVPLQYVDGRGEATQRYPANPNGSPLGVAGVRSRDGRVLAMMPHPERTVLKDAASYLPSKEVVEEWGEFGPWVRLFKSARRWVG